MYFKCGVCDVSSLLLKDVRPREALAEEQADRLSVRDVRQLYSRSLSDLCSKQKCKCVIFGLSKNVFFPLLFQDSNEEESL